MMQTFLKAAVPMELMLRAAELLSYDSRRWKYDNIDGVMGPGCQFNLDYLPGLESPCCSVSLDHSIENGHSLGRVFAARNTFSQVHAFLHTNFSYFFLLLFLILQSLLE